MGGGTELFPDLGAHCQQPDCYLLDFLPFNCDRCHKVFCLDHRTYKSHECPIPDRKDRKIVKCEICTASIETTGLFGEDEKALIEKHKNTKACDPLLYKKPRCPIKRCKEVLTFQNNHVCRFCDIKVCLNHRFPAEHACKRMKSSAVVVADNDSLSKKLLAAVALRNGKDCGKKPKSPTSTSHSVQAY